MTARIHCASDMLTVYRRPHTRAGQGWPGFPEVIEVRWGESYNTPVKLLEIVGDEAVRDLIEKLTRALEGK